MKEGRRRRQEECRKNVASKNASSSTAVTGTGCSKNCDAVTGRVKVEWKFHPSHQVTNAIMDPRPGDDVGLSYVQGTFKIVGPLTLSAPGLLA